MYCAAKEEIAASQEPDRPVRVLIADDNRAVRAALSAVVDGTAGFELAAVATSAAEAIELSSRLAPDVVLMDMRMDGMSGIEATRKIVGARPETFVVLMSASPPPDFASAADGCGAAGFINKRAVRAVTLTEMWRRRVSPSPSQRDLSIRDHTRRE